MKKRTVKILGFDVDIYAYPNKQYMYPSFNGDAEFVVSRKGFRQLSHYLRNIIWMDKIVKQTLNA